MKHFSINEMCKSSHAIKNGMTNLPPKEALKNLNTLIVEILDPLREIYGHPIFVTSGYRSKELNEAIGGSRNSQHTTGQAVDIKCGNNEIVFNLIKKNFSFDQLIDEKKLSWIHVSYVKGANRKQVISIR